MNAGDDSFNDADMSHGGAGLYFKLTKSLDLSSVCGSEVGTWEPIGSNVIDNLYINPKLDDSEKTDFWGYGLFGVGASLGEDTLTISNVVIGKNASVSASGNASVGAVLGYANGNVVLESCVNKGCVNGLYGFVGGIAGELNASDIMISKCSNSGAVIGRSFAAGIVGKADASENKAKIEFCKNVGPVSSGDRAGGIAFFLKNVSLESVYNSGNVRASIMAAGIVDSSAGNVLHYMCVNAGEFEAASLAAGIAAYGRANRAIFSKCLNIGTVFKAPYTGGIVAFANAGAGSELKITNSINAGEIFDPYADIPELSETDVNDDVGGIIGACRSETCNVKNNLDLLTVDVEGGLKSEDLLGKIPEGFNFLVWSILCFLSM